MDGPMLVLAGPGSGKTTVITHRVKNLIEKGVNPSEILVITFTKAAAMEMKNRFLLLAGAKEVKEAATKVSFGTFHAIFFTILKYAYHFQSSNVVSDEQKYAFMRELMAHYRVDVRDETEFISDVLGEISYVKNARIDIGHFYSGCCGESLFRDIYRGYERKLKDHRLIDFDDMLVYTYELFDQRKDILKAWQEKFSYILIDEFQDINRLQYDIIRMMIQRTNNLFVVGDDDQSVYRFRGSMPEIMLHFRDDYSTARIVKLQENYRCEKHIVEAAEHLISHNKERFPKDIFTSKDSTGTTRFLTFANQREENLFVIREIEKEIKAGKNYQDIAVLFRTNLQPRLFMEQLLDFNIPFHSRDRIPNIYEHWIAKDILTYMGIAAGNRERSEFIKIMNKPKRYIGRDSLCESTVAFDEWMKMYDEQPWIAERIEKLWYDIRMLKSMSPYAAINYIRKGIDYDSYLVEYADYRNVNKEDLFDVLEDIQASAKDYKTYEQWLEHIETYGKELEKVWEQKKQNSQALQLATLHSAKGLEFCSVYILDVNEGTMPYKKAVLDRDMEEERRLFYVGMTRAKQNLTICSTKSVQNKEAVVSRFIQECQSSSKESK